MISFKMNNPVYIQLTDQGILKYIEKHNEGMPKKYHISFNDVKKSIVDGFFEIQMHQLIMYFGSYMMDLSRYMSMNIKIPIN